MRLTNINIDILVSDLKTQNSALFATRTRTWQLVDFEMIRPNMLKKYTAPLAPNHSDDPSGTQPQRAQSVQRRTSEQPVPSKGKKKGSRRKFNSDSVNAPYEKLVPIPEDDNAMDTSTADIVPDVKFNDILVPDAASLVCLPLIRSRFLSANFYIYRSIVYIVTTSGHIFGNVKERDVVTQSVWGNSPGTTDVSMPVQMLIWAKQW